MIKLHRLNNEVVQPIPRLEPEDKRPVKGADLFPLCYCNIACIGKKNCGKTTVLFHCLKKCITPFTKVIFFVSTLYADPNYKSIRKYLKDKDIDFEGYTSIIQDDGTNKLDELIVMLDAEAQLREAEEEEKKKKGRKNKAKVIMCDSDSDSEDDDDKAKRKYKYRGPDYFIVLDDMSSESRNNSVGYFMRKQRHYRNIVFCASQHLKDLDPGECKQIDYWLLFRGLSEDKIKHLLENTTIPLELPQFVRLYKIAIKPTLKEKKPFFYIDSNEGSYRRCFNTTLALENKNLDE